MNIIIVGGSISGLACALALSQAGHQVHILERDADEPPPTVADAHESWRRPTVPQATHSHAFASLGVGLLLRRAPEIYRALVAAGAAEIRLGERMPPSLTDRTPEPGDADLVMLGCRRSTFELVFRREVMRRGNVRFSRGVRINGLEVSSAGMPRITGVRTASGRTWHGDLVIDATGRRSLSARWLAEAGLPQPEQRVEDCAISYFTRYYQLNSPQPPGPLNRGFGAGWLWDFFTAVLFIGDNGTFSISVGVHPKDKSLRALRFPEAFTAAIRTTPLLAPWLEPGASEPISPVYAMGGLDNSLSAVAAAPVPGLFPVGDAVCTTNPAYGRGVSLALAHAYEFADLLAAYPQVSVEQAAEAARMTERLMTPWWSDAVANDRGRAELWRSGMTGGAVPSPPEGVVTFGSAAAAAATDPVVWRRLVRVMMSLDSPSSLYGDEEVRMRVKQALAGGHGAPMPGPSRQEFVDTVTNAAQAADSQR